MLEKEFQALGLNENEQKVYLAVLSAGKAAPSRIARETGINRTTVYSISRKLMSLGLIGEDLGAKVAYLYAQEPTAVAEMFAKEEAQLAQKKKIAAAVAHQLASLPRNKSYSVPKITFIEEEDLSDYLYKQYPLWAQSGEQLDNTWWGYHDSSFTEHYKEWIDWSWKHGPKDLKVRFLTNEKQVEQEISNKFPERKLKFVEGKEFDSSLWIIGDFVLMTQSRQHPHYLVELHDPVFARNQRELFKAFWEK
jgi:sugar-specific transcriptional regulator TrmB